MRSLSTTLAALALVVGWANSRQLAFPNQELTFDDNRLRPEIHDAGEIATLSETIVSSLSSSSQHTTLIRLLQRSKCIPLLAHIGNATLFAPTDAAWEAWSNTHKPKDDGQNLYSGWLSSDGLQEWTMDENELLSLRIAHTGNEEEERRRLDNQQWALRQHLFYHMLNYTLSPSAFIASDSINITTETTLLYPSTEEPVHPPVPPPGPPWLPRGGDGLLGGHGQRLRVAKLGSDQGGERGKVGLDFTGEGGVGVWDGSGWKQDDVKTLSKRDKVVGARWVRNGVLVGIDGVLDPPPSIDEIIRTHPSLSYLSRLLAGSFPLPSPLPEDLSTTPHLTVFAPSNDAFDGAFDEIETRYLEGGYGAEGVARIVGGGVVLALGKDEVGWRDHWGDKRYDEPVESASGDGLVVEAPSDGNLNVNGTNATAIDIFASNGVIHILPSLLLPENFTVLNSAEKTLLSVNATRFVSLLRSANLSHTYVGEPGKDKQKDEPWTILAPTDEVLDMMDRWGGHGAPLPEIWRHAESKGLSIESSNMTIAQDLSEPFKDVSPIAALLQYHILPGRLTPADVKDGMLVGTEMRTSALKGGRQRLRVDVSDRLDRVHWDNVGEGEIRFGGATVLGRPVKSGKSIIYLLSSLLSPPDDVLQTAVSDLELSTFIAAVYSADLDRAVKKTPGVMYLIPRNRAFNALGLGMKYLLLPEGKDELRKVIRYHALDEVVYSSDLEVGRTVHKTLEGGDIVLRRTKGKNSTLSVLSPTKWEGHESGESLPSNGELRPARITHMDALTDTGVIHTTDSVVMPADVSLTVAKLISGSRQSTMLDLMMRAGLSWILDGREPTSEEVAQAALQGIVQTWDIDGGPAKQPDLDLGSLAMPSYTVLCPTDKAFSRLNLTRYLSDRDVLLELLKLHIIPTQSNTPRTGSNKAPAEPPRDGQPLSLGDDLVYSTLLSSSSKYGEVAFRATGDNSFIVGIRNARGGMGNDAARVGASGRASVRWRKAVSSTAGLLKKDGKDDEGEDDEGDGSNMDLWRGGMALGGGVLVIDSVLVPYEPSWFSRWGWLVITLVGVGAIVLIAGASFGWWWFTRGKSPEGYESLEGEEEE